MKYQKYSVYSFLKVIISAVLITIISVSCNTEQSLDSELSNLHDSPIQNEPVLETEIPIEKEEIIPRFALLDQLLSADEATYDIKKERYEINELLWLEYPRLENMQDLLKQNNINSIIKDFVLNINEELKFSIDNEKYFSSPQYNVEYDIKISNEKFISIAFAPSLYSGENIDSSFEDKYVALNINLETASILKAIDIFNINKKFILTALKTKYSTRDIDGPLENVLHISEIEEFADGYATEFIIEKYARFYYTENNLGIIMDLMRHMGNYIIFEIPYSELEEFKATDMQRVEFVEIESAGINWDQIEFSIDPNEIGIPVNTKAISAKEDAIMVGEAIIDNCRKNNEFPTYVLLKIVHSTKDNIWRFDYSINQTDKDVNDLLDCGGFYVAIDGSNCEVIKAWVDE